MIYLPPPTPFTLHTAIHYVYDDMAESLNGKIVIGPTHRVGHSSRYSFTRIVGPHPYRFRVVITTIPDYTGDFENDISLAAQPA